MALGDVFQAVERCEDAIAIYETVPQTAAVRRNADIQIGLCLAALEKADEAVARLRSVSSMPTPRTSEAAIASATSIAPTSRFTEAATAYTHAHQTRCGDPDEDRLAASIYYRGISLERAKRWPEAEADFKQALAHQPGASRQC